MNSDSHYDDDVREPLIVRYYPDDDGTGKLHVSAATQGFAGQSAAWFDTERLLDFARSLSTYPIPEDMTLEIASGFGANETAGHPPQEHVAISVAPVGSRGQLKLRVHLATPVWPTEGPAVQHHDVCLEMLTTYERLRSFSSHLAMVLRRELPDATLGTEVLS
ncbi:MAG: hypothetical protein JWO62_98 [Acidimicrobiaceae bacterium]|nr:hypothetical protein [Acidimicrobiaceae bacterium]